ncbi:MAG: hypothetical protein M1818_003021 [Claussenomyces sp. TS43310]|nr:MAG: hypothetical protein M1818_003021 [Claussenomyces sp. TS43310]
MSDKLFSRETVPTKLFINNEWTESKASQRLTLLNPKDDSPISSDVHAAGEQDVDLAVEYAKTAFEEGPWSTFTGEQRAKCLNKLADLIDAHAEEIGYLESICSGRLVSMTTGEISRVTSVFRYYAGWADKIKGDSYAADDGFYKIVRPEPLGVCVGITAWNASLHFLSWKSAPALACGNTMIIKASEKSPLGTLAIGYLIKEAGFPPGVFQIVNGGGLTGALLAAHMNVAKISFTGSIGTGKKIQEAATKSNLKRVTLELGGKSPAIVFDDAVFEKAIFWSMMGITINSGQVCAASSRLYVQEGIAEKFIGALKAQFDQIGQGLGADPQENTTMYGPLVDKGQHDRVLSYIEEGKKEAKLVAGGTPNKGPGQYISPVIFLDPTDDASVYKEEIFGPVLCIKTFKTEEEVLRMANNSTYGLAGSVFTQDVSRAFRVSSKLHGGSIGVNCAMMVGPQVPMGGFKQSGYGRELGEYALRHYTEPKSIWFRAEELGLALVEPKIILDTGMYQIDDPRCIAVEDTMCCQPAFMQEIYGAIHPE